MATNEARITITADARWSTLWIGVIKHAAPILVPFFGEQRVLDLAGWGALRLMRYRLDDGRWHWMKPEDQP